MSKKICPICHGSGRLAPSERNYWREQYVAWHNAGAAEQLKRCEKAVYKSMINKFDEADIFHVITAIRAAAIKEKP